MAKGSLGFFWVLGFFWGVLWAIVGFPMYTLCIRRGALHYFFIYTTLLIKRKNGASVVVMVVCGIERVKCKIRVL